MGSAGEDGKPRTERRTRATFQQGAGTFRVHRTPATEVQPPDEAHKGEPEPVGPVQVSSPATPASPPAQEELWPSPVAKAAVEALRTKELASAELRRALTRRAMPTVTAKALRPLMEGLAPHVLERLDAILSGAWEPEQADGAHSPKRALEHLIHESGVGMLPPKVRAAFLEVIARDPSELSSIKAAHTLVRSGTVHELVEPEAQNLGRLFAELSCEGRAHLATAALQRRRARGPRLSDRDRTGASLAQNLSALATQSLSRTHFALETLAHPERMPLTGGSPGIANTLLFALALYQPSELVFLLLCHTYSDGAAHEPYFSVPGGAKPRTYTDHGVVMEHQLLRSLRELFGLDFATISAPARARDWLYGKERFDHPCFVALRSIETEVLFLLLRAETDRILVQGPFGTTPPEWFGVRMVPNRKFLEPGTYSIASSHFWDRFGLLAFA